MSEGFYGSADDGHPANADGLSSVDGAVNVSTLRASIHDACLYCGNSGICGWDATPQFCGMCHYGKAAINGWNAASKKRGSPLRVKPYNGMQNDLLKLSPEMQAEVRLVCTATCTIHRRPNQPIDPCIDRNHACYRCQELAAKAIEARSGETERLDPQGESAARRVCPQGENP